MAEDAGQDKTEAPTARRRQEAADAGNYARSRDLTGSLVLIGGLLLLRWFGLGIIASLHSVMAEMLAPESLTNFDAGRLEGEVVHLFGVVGLGLAPVLGGIILTIIIANISQVGLVFNTARIAPNFAALNPTRGLSRIFSRGQGLMSLAMNMVKVLLVGLVGYSAVGGRMSQIISVQQYSFLQIFGIGCDLVYQIGIRIGVLLLILAILDYFYQRYRHEQDLKMTKQEVKDEMRRMEGDPKVKQRRRQVAMQRLMQKLKKDIPTADVVVTNPTHYAVALKYDEKSMRAPKLVGKGADFMAQRIRELAVAAGVPIIERAPLARAIYRMVDVGDEIPEEFYSAVAEILAYVYELTGKFKRAAVPA
jgi:flagellar biosynthesis protein FlhB